MFFLFFIIICIGAREVNTILKEKKFNLMMSSIPSNVIGAEVPLGCSECGYESILDCPCFTGIYYVHTQNTFCYNCQGETHMGELYRDLPRMICINSGSFYCTYCNSCKKNTCDCCKKCGYDIHTSCICCSICKENPTMCYCILCSICCKSIDDPTCYCGSPEWFAYQADLYNEDHYYSHNEGKYKTKCSGPCSCRWC